MRSKTELKVTCQTNALHLERQFVAYEDGPRQVLTSCLRLFRSTLSLRSTFLRHSVRSDLWVSVTRTIVRPKTASLPLAATSAARTICASAGTKPE